MTTIVVVRKNGYAAVAADTLTKWGSTKESAEFITNHRKILRVGTSLLAVSGPSAGHLALGDFFTRRSRRRAGVPRLESVAAIYRLWQELHSALREDYFLRPNEEDNDAFESSRISVLIANAGGIFGVDALRTVQQYRRFYAYGRGNEYAMGAMYAVYDRPDFDADAIARYGVEVAAQFDDGTGLPIDSEVVKLRRGV
jgi:ATP-dependent protease HslVU (ClpYQ) peptidase subunit